MRLSKVLDNLIKMQSKGSIEKISANITLAYITFTSGTSEQTIPYSTLGLIGKRIYTMITTCNSSDGNYAPEAQIYNTVNGIKIALHDSNGIYTIKQNAGYFLMVFHES